MTTIEEQPPQGEAQATETPGEPAVTSRQGLHPPDAATSQEEEAVKTAEERGYGEYELVVHLPDPSIAPLIIAIGVAVIMTGILTGVGQVLLGLLIFACGLGGWVYQDVQVARRGEHHHH